MKKKYVFAGIFIVVIGVTVAAAFSMVKKPRGREIIFRKACNHASGSYGSGAFPVCWIFS